MEQPGLEPAPTWDAGVASSGFTTYAMTQAHSMLGMRALKWITVNTSSNLLRFSEFSGEFFFFNLKGRDRIRDLPSTGSLPKCSQPGRGQAKARSQDSTQAVAGTQVLERHWLHPRVHVSRKLEWEVEERDLNPGPDTGCGLLACYLGNALLGVYCLELSAVPHQCGLGRQSTPV